MGRCTQPNNSQMIPQSMMKYLGLARLAYLSGVSCLNFMTKTPASGQDGYQGGTLAFGPLCSV
jgi:hypothetical protein